MEKITILSLLEKYRKWVANSKIQFIKSGSEEEKNILKILDTLISDFKIATEKKGGLSENLDWYNTHQHGKLLWQKLASCAINQIDSESKGNSKLFDFLEAATEFEDILYGLEQYYRDHTLHSLWVYFIGEYIMRDLMPEIHNNLNWYLYNDIEEEKTSHPPSLVKESIKKEKDLIKRINHFRDSIWCLIGLCHDLGYSLAKLNKLNNKVENVLKFFEFPDFRHIGYSMDIEHQYHFFQFLELMAMDVRIVPSMDNKKEVLIKCYRDDSIYWLLCRAIEKRQHGVLSSYLIYKLLGLFGNTSVRGPAEEWGLDDDEVVYNIIIGDILYAVAQHEFDFAYLTELSSLADILVLADELEEFSRYGRQMFSRKYYDTTAESKITISPKNPKHKDVIKIEISYNVIEQHNLNKFFIRKAERLCRMYSLQQRQKDSKYCKINSIQINAYKDKEKLSFQLCSDKDNKAYLPEVNINMKTYHKGLYAIKYRDDKLLVKTKDNLIPLDTWFNNVNS